MPLPMLGKPSSISGDPVIPYDMIDWQPDGSVIQPNGAVVPPFAACYPDTIFDPQLGICVPAPGAINIMYECGGPMAPHGSFPGCESPAQAKAREEFVTPPLTTPLPSITVTAKMLAADVEPSLWCRINQWINDNPLLALGVAGAGAVLMSDKRRGR